MKVRACCAEHVYDDHIIMIKKKKKKGCQDADDLISREAIFLRRARGFLVEFALVRRVFTGDLGIQVRDRFWDCR